ncbi:MAG: serine hydrolase [Halioglobus sp.]|nr:serine hydrolase [Halioglobus sp.]
MSRRLPVLIICAAFQLAACQHTPAWDGSLEKLLESQPERFATVMKDPQRYRVQIIYTRIDRDAANNPSFRSYSYRLNKDEYFYPASTVKLPTALIALETLNRLGVPRDAGMFTGKAADFQTVAITDESAPSGLPSVEHYIRKILLVSDNDAFNRLYELIGQGPLNEALSRHGLTDSRIVHRLETVLSTEQNRLTNPVDFVVDGKAVYEQEAAYSEVSYVGEKEQLLGLAEIVEGKRLERPKDFSVKNAYPLQDQHDLLLALLFPEAVDENRRFDISAEDLSFVYRWMSTYPGESGIPQYADAQEYPPGYVKFLMYEGKAGAVDDNIRILNKVGDAYGFLTDAAYIVDFENGVEFLLAATIYTNDNQTFNDGEYEYDTIGLPFLRDLGQAVYELELARPRLHRPDLSRFRFDNRGIVKGEK